MDHQKFYIVRGDRSGVFFGRIVERHDREVTLTGSCLMGRQQFAKEHGVDLDAGMTVREFIKLTENAYGGSTIRKLKEFYS